MQKIVLIIQSVEREFTNLCIFAFLFVIFLALPAAAQWRQVLAVNEAVNRTYFVPNSHLAIAASGVGPDYDSSSLWRSTDDGETWTRAMPNYFNAGSVTDIAFEDTMTGWVSFVYGGSKNVIKKGSIWVSYLWKTTDGGKSWFPLNGPSNVDVYEGVGLFYNPYFSLLSVNVTFLSTDGGISWLPPAQYANGMANGLTGYFFLDSTHGAAGWSDDEFAITSDGGFTWNEIVPAFFPCPVRPSGYYKDGKRYYIVASPHGFEFNTDSTANTIVLTSDDGATWDSISTIPWGPGPNYLNFITGDIERDCNIFYLNAGDSGLYRSNDSGKNWFCIGGPWPVWGTYSSLFSVSDGRILDGSANGGIWLYTPPAYAMQFSTDMLTAQIDSLARIPIAITNANGNLSFDSSSFEFDYDTNAFIFEGVKSSSGYFVRFQDLNGSLLLKLIKDTSSKVTYDTATVTILLNPILSIPRQDSSFVTVHSALFNDLSVCAPVTQSVITAIVNIEPGCGDSTILAVMHGEPLFSIQSIVPNPAQNEVRVEGTGLSNVAMELYDVLGNLTTPRPLLEKEGEITLDVSPLPPGIYYLRFSSNGYVQTRSISIQR